MPKNIEDYTLAINIDVAWGDMDAFQHVNNTQFFKYFESARIAYFEKIEALEVMAAKGHGPILASASCKFIRPLTFPDKVMAATAVKDIKESSFIMEYALYSESQKHMAAVGEGLIVYFDYNKGQKCPIPEEIRTAIESIENTV